MQLTQAKIPAFSPIISAIPGSKTHAERGVSEGSTPRHLGTSRKIQSVNI
jgi:hypothetical protein